MGKIIPYRVEFQYTGIPFGMFREHPEQKTHDPLRTIESLLETAAKLIALADCFSEKTKGELIADLYTYRVKYQSDYWRGSGRLARIGLPSEVVTQLRNLKTTLLKMI